MRRASSFVSERNVVCDRSVIRATSTARHLDYDGGAPKCSIGCMVGFERIDLARGKLKLLLERSNSLGSDCSRQNYGLWRSY